MGAEPDAEASADPYYLGGYGGYRGYGGYGLGYSTLGYSRLGYSRFGYGGLYGRYGGYRYGYGKREAEAEPEADAEASADPYYLGIQRIWRIWLGILYSRILSSRILSYRIRRSTEDTEDTDTDMASVRLRLSPR